MTLATLTIIRDTLVTRAAELMAAYPQYAGHFDGYVVVQLRREVKTKMGVAFTKGQLAIARPEAHTSVSLAGKTGTFYTVWSDSNRCDTSVKASDVLVVTK